MRRGIVIAVVAVVVLLTGVFVIKSLRETELAGGGEPYLAVLLLSLDGGVGQERRSYVFH